MASAVFGPFRASFKYMQRQAHESPAVFWSVVIGCIGPVAAVAVPPVRRSMGWQPTERIPNTYPLPKRAREEVTGYDDDEQES